MDFVWTASAADTFGQKKGYFAPTFLRGKETPPLVREAGAGLATSHWECTFTLLGKNWTKMESYSKRRGILCGSKRLQSRRPFNGSFSVWIVPLQEHFTEKPQSHQGDWSGDSWYCKARKFWWLLISEKLWGWREWLLDLGCPAWPFQEGTLAPNRVQWDTFRRTMSAVMNLSQAAVGGKRNKMSISNSVTTSSGSLILWEASINELDKNKNQIGF
jgi:hypothetical protein